MTPSTQMISPSPSDSPVPADSPVPSPTSFARRFRRIVLWTMIVSFSAAALGGIIVLLGDYWSDTAGRVLATTALTGAFSLAVLCGAPLIGKRLQWFGLVTILIAVATWGMLVVSTWADIEAINWQWSVSGALLTVTTSAAALVLQLVRSRALMMRLALALAMVVLACATAVTLIAIWDEHAFDIGWFYRLNGILWILAGLGVVLVPVASLLMRRADAGAVAHGPVISAPTLSPAAIERLTAAAQAQGLSPDEFVDHLLGSSGGRSR